MVTLVLGGLLIHSALWSGRRKRAQLIDGMGLLQPDELRELARLLFVHPNLGHRIRHAYLLQERIELYQGGDSYATYHRFMKHFWRANVALPDGNAAKKYAHATPNRLAPTPFQLPPKWQAHGRTLTFNGTRGENLALKLPKLHGDALEREDLMDQCFERWKIELDLKSDLPRSHGLLLFAPDSKVRAAIAAQAAASGEAQFDIASAPVLACLLYEAIYPAIRMPWAGEGKRQNETSVAIHDDTKRACMPPLLAHPASRIKGLHQMAQGGRTQRREMSSSCGESRNEALHHSVAVLRDGNDLPGVPSRLTRGGRNAMGPQVGTLPGFTLSVTSSRQKRTFIS